MMDLEKTWADLEASMPTGRLGRMERGVQPDAPVELGLAVTNPGRVRSFALTTAGVDIDELVELPEAEGLRTTLERQEAQGPATLEIALEDPAARDVFTVLAGDIITATSRCSDGESAVKAWITRLRRWQKLLQRAPVGLSAERQRGLYAELWMLREELLPILGIDEAVAAWAGPENAVHDFQTRAMHIEVKSSAAGQPQVARINGERQLDETGTPGLALAHFSLAISKEEGESLPEIVDAVREHARARPGEDPLEERLIDAGYHDVHEPRYRSARYTLREARLFRVGPGFPRIIESELAEGLGGVHYRLAIAACDEHETPMVGLAAALTEAYQA